MALHTLRRCKSQGTAFAAYYLLWRPWLRHNSGRRKANPRKSKKIHQTHDRTLADPFVRLPPGRMLFATMGKEHASFPATKQKSAKNGTSIDAYSLRFFASKEDALFSFLWGF